MRNIKAGLNSPEKSVASHISALIKKEAGPVLVLFSGGSSLAVLDHLDTECFRPGLCFGIVDERVTDDIEGSNFAALSQSTRVVFALREGVELMDVLYRGEGVSSYSEKFESSLRSWYEGASNGVVIALLGVGLDGHTAGIFPNENEVKFREMYEGHSKWVVGHECGTEPYPARVTVTLTFLKTVVDHTVMFLSGEEKRSALERVLSLDGEISLTPARVIREMKNPTLFTDLSFK